MLAKGMWWLRVWVMSLQYWKSWGIWDIRWPSGEFAIVCYRLVVKQNKYLKLNLKLKLKLTYLVLISCLGIAWDEVWCCSRGVSLCNIADPNRMCRFLCSCQQRIQLSKHKRDIHVTEKTCFNYSHTPQSLKQSRANFETRENFNFFFPLDLSIFASL